MTSNWMRAGMRRAVGGACLGLLAASTGGSTAHATTVSVRQALPTGVPATSVLEVEQVLPREVKRGQPFDYRIVVTNIAACPLEDVVLTQTLPAGAAVVGSFPQAEIGAGGAVNWRLGALALRESRAIQARAQVDNLGAYTFCVDATYRLPVCATTVATQPDLTLLLEAPLAALRCDDIPVRLTVQNRGTGATTNVALRYALPDGLVAAGGRRDFEFVLPVLAAGETRQALIPTRAVRSGNVSHRAAAVSAEGLRAEARAETAITEPVLRVTQRGSDSQYAGRAVTFSFTVANEGSAPARNVLVEDFLPAGTVLESAAPAVQESSPERVVWTIPVLQSGEAREFSVTVRSGVAGTLNNRVTARADCAEDAGAVRESVVRGIPALLLEVVDVDDPIEVGGQETYIITVTNQGSAVGTGIVIRCDIEGNFAYLSSDGPTAGVAADGIVTFAPLPQLAPKAKAEWRVVCTARKPGDVRFRVILSSDQLTRPVEETESTFVY